MEVTRWVLFFCLWSRFLDFSRQLLLAIGLIGAGLLAIPILTASSAYAVDESFGWKRGLNRKLANAREFYALIAGSTIIAMILDFIGTDPMKVLFWAAVLNGVLAPPILIIIMLLSRNRRLWQVVHTLSRIRQAGIYMHGNFGKALDAQREYMEQLLAMKLASEAHQ